MKIGLGVVLLLGVAGSGAQAQQVPARRFVLVPASVVERLPLPLPQSLPHSLPHLLPLPLDSVVRAHPAKMALGGLIGGAAGLYLGGVLGANLGGGALSGGDVRSGWDDLANAVLFGAIGESLGMALGVHLANHRRGSYWWDALAVAGTGFILLIPAASIDNAWVIIPVAQLWSGIVVERRTTR